MILKGLSRYDVTDDGVTVEVRSTSSGNRLTLGFSGFNLIVDNGERKCFSQKWLRFFMKNPNLDICSMQRRRGDGKMLDSEGNLRKKEEPVERRYTSFTSPEDALRTALAMVEVARGNLMPVYDWLDDRTRGKAAYTVAKLLHTHRDRVMPYLDEAEEEFLDRMGRGAFTVIKPLFSMFCMVLKGCYLTGERRRVTGGRRDVVMKIRGIY